MVTHLIIVYDYRLGRRYDMVVLGQQSSFVYVILLVLFIKRQRFDLKSNLESINFSKYSTNILHDPRKYANYSVPAVKWNKLMAESE